MSHVWMTIVYRWHNGGFPTLGRCDECGKHIWPWQGATTSILETETRTDHHKCIPDEKAPWRGAARRRPPPPPPPPQPETPFKRW